MLDKRSNSGPIHWRKRQMVVALGSLIAGLGVFIPYAILITGCVSSPSIEATPKKSAAKDSGEESIDKLVVLLHGLGRTSLSMHGLANYLEDEGFRVATWGYSSTDYTVKELGQQFGEALENIEGATPDRIHFVGHSLGNIVIRQTLGEHPPKQPGRVVMLAPPNQGSHEAERYTRFMEWMLEPLDGMRTQEGSVATSVSKLGDREVGIIAGEHDGKVAVEETKLATQDDHEVVEAATTFIMNDAEARELVAEFLKRGEFGRDQSVSGAGNE